MAALGVAFLAPQGGRLRQRSSQLFWQGLSSLLFVDERLLISVLLALPASPAQFRLDGPCLEHTVLFAWSSRLHGGLRVQELFAEPSSLESLNDRDGDRSASSDLHNEYWCCCGGRRIAADN